MKKINRSLLTLFCAAFVASVVSAQEASNPTLTPKAKKKAEVKKEQAQNEVVARKMHEPFWKRLDEAMLEQLGTPLTHRPRLMLRLRQQPVASRPRHSIRRHFQMAIGKSVEAPSSATPASSRPIR